MSLQSEFVSKSTALTGIATEGDDAVQDVAVVWVAPQEREDEAKLKRLEKLCRTNPAGMQQTTKA